MIAIISDIHGNYPALKAVLDDIDKRNIKNIICLGDTSGYYCMINECIDALIERNIISLKGNHDYYLISGEGCPRSNSANRCLEYQMSILKPSNKTWLENLRSSSLIIDDKHFVHGGWNDELDEYLYEVSKEYFQNRNEKYFFSGHTHVPIIFNMENKIYCNPGSVGQPRDGNPKSSYAIFNNGKVENVRVNYDIEMIAYYMKNSGFEKYFYENLYLGSKIGGGVSTTFVKG